jgi:hypothetical protein
MKAKFKINESFDSPENDDYDILGFQKKRTFNAKGELYLIEYYEDFDGATYHNLIVKEERQYIRDPQSGWVYMRLLTVTWYLEDDSVGYTKTSKKFYSMPESYDEGKSRRGNVINNTSIYLLGLVGETDGIDFMNYVTTEIDLYVKGSVLPLINKVGATTKPYMLSGTPCVRDIILSLLNAGV